MDQDDKPAPPEFQRAKGNDPNHSNPYDRTETISTLESYCVQNQELKNFSEFIHRLNELELTVTTPVSDSQDDEDYWDSMYTGIIQNVVKKYQPDCVQDIIPSVQILLHSSDNEISGSSMREIISQESPEKNWTVPISSTTAVQLEVLLNRSKRESPFNSSTMNRILDGESTERKRLNQFLSILERAFECSIRLDIFNWERWMLTTVSQVNDSSSSNSIQVVLVEDLELKVLRNIIPAFKLTSNLQEYCVNILNLVIENQDMTKVMFNQFTSISTADFHDMVQANLEILKLVTTITEFNQKLFTAEFPVPRNLEILSKYEEQLLENEDDTAEKILQLLKMQYLHNLSSASQSVLMARTADHREKTYELQEQEEELIIDNDRLEILIEEKEMEKEKTEKELESLRTQLQTSQADKKNIEAQIAKKLAELAETVKFLKLNNEKIAWNYFKKTLMELQVSYDNLKRGSQVGKMEGLTLQKICEKILEQFNLTFPSPGMKIDVFDYTKAHDTQENRMQVVQMIEFLFDPPIISRNAVNRDIIEVKGRQVIASQIIKQIETESFSEVRIIAGTTLYLDTDMSNATFHGKNVVLTSPSIEIFQATEINTSGLDGNPITIPGKASSGQQPGRNGTDGTDGNPGESAGHVCIQATQILGSQYLQIVSNGGNGGNGQDGGDGRDGDDGIEGRDGHVEQQNSWTSTTNYCISQGTGGRYGGRGGSGGKAGLGGHPGKQGQISLLGNNSEIETHNAEGQKGRDGNPGRGATGGRGGRNGTDHGCAWHNYAFAGREYRYARGKLDKKRQKVWYGGNGWMLIVVRSEQEIRNSKAANGEHGHRGQSAAERALDRKPAKDVKQIHQTEISALSVSVRSLYTHQDLQSVIMAGNNLGDEKTALETQGAKLNAEKERAEQTKREIEQKIADTEQAIVKNEELKAQLEQILKQSVEEVENNVKKMAQVAEELKKQEGSTQIIKESEKAAAQISQVIQTHQTDQKAELLAQTTNQKAGVLKEYDHKSSSVSTSQMTPVLSLDSDEKERIKGLYEEVKGLQNIDILSDEFFAIALAAKCAQTPDLSNAIEIGFEAIKSASSEGSKLSEVTRSFIKAHCEELSNGKVTQTPITPVYIREKLPKDTLIASSVQSWANANPKCLLEIQKACGDFKGSDIQTFLLHFRTSNKFQKIRKIEQLYKSLKGLKKSNHSVTKMVEGLMIIDHLEEILMDHVSSWFLVQSKQLDIPQEAKDKAQGLLEIVTTIFFETQEILPSTSLQGTFQLFLAIVKNPKFHKDEEQDIWQSLILQLTKLVTSSAPYKTDVILTKQLDLVIKSVKSGKNNLEQTDIERLQVLAYVLPYVNLTPVELDLMSGRCRQLKSIISGQVRVVYAAVHEVHQQVFNNFVTYHEVPKVDLTESQIQHMDIPFTFQQKLFDKLNEFLKKIDSPYQPLEFQKRFELIQDFLAVLSKIEDTPPENISQDVYLDQLMSELFENVETDRNDPPYDFLQHFETTTKSLISALNKLNQNPKRNLELLGLEVLKHYDSYNSMCHKLYESQLSPLFQFPEPNLKSITKGLTDFYSSTGKECPILIRSAVDSFQRLLSNSWEKSLVHCFRNVSEERVKSSNSLDQVIQACVDIVTSVVQDSTQIYNREEFVVAVKVHLLKIASGWQYVHSSSPNSSLPNLAQVMNEIQSSFKSFQAEGTKPIEFLTRVVETINSATNSIPIKIFLTVPDSTVNGNLQHLIDEFNRNFKSSPSFTPLMQNFFTAGPQNNTFEIQEAFFYQLGQIRLYSTLLSGGHFTGEEEDMSIKESEAQGLIEFLKVKFNSVDIKEYEARLLEEFAKIITITASRDDLGLCNLIQKSRQGLDDDWSRAFEELYLESRRGLENIFLIYESSDEVLTYGPPVTHYMEQLENMLIKFDKVNYNQTAVVSISGDIDKLYLESSVKYFNLQSIPTLPTELRAGIWNLTSGNKTLTDIYEIFKCHYAKGLQVMSWAPPFLVLFKEFIHLMKPPFPTTCHEVHALCLIISDTKKDSKITITEYLLEIELELAVLAQNICKSQIIEKDDPGRDDALDALEKAEMASWALFRHNTNQSEFITKIYSVVSSALNFENTIRCIMEAIYAEFEVKVQPDLKNKLVIETFKEEDLSELMENGNPYVVNVSLAIFILKFRLNDLERAFCRRVFKGKHIFMPNQEQMEKIKLLFTPNNETSENESNRIVQVLSSVLQVKDKNLAISFLNGREQKIVKNLILLKTGEEYEETIKFIKEILEGHLESEWVTRLEGLVKDSQFGQILKLYERSELFVGVWEFSKNQDTTEADLLKLFRLEFKSFAKSHFESPSVNQKLLEVGQKMDFELPGKNSLGEYVEQVIKFKYLFNRCFYFADSESQGLSEWLSLLYQRCKLRKLHLSELNDLLYRSVELKIPELIEIGRRASFETWMEGILIRIVIQNLETLVNKIMTRSSIQSISEDQDIKYSEVASQLEKSKPCFWKNRLLAILGDKLQEEIQFASDSTPIHLENLKTVFFKISDQQFEKDHVQELFENPISRWTRTFKKHNLQAEYDTATTNAILKFEEKFGVQSTGKLLAIFRPLQKHDSTTVLTFFQNFNRIIWQFDGTMLDRIESVSNLKVEPEKKLKQMKETCQAYFDEFRGRHRNCQELCRVMCETPKNVGISQYVQRFPTSAEVDAPLEKHCKLERLVNQVKEKLGGVSLIDSKITIPICDWTISHVTQWLQKAKIGNRQERLNRIESNISEVVTVISKTLDFLPNKFMPRDTQLIAVILLLDHSVKRKGCLAEVATGEGKTIIVAMSVIIRALCGDNVDVITSSPILAEENLAEVADLYSLFEIQAACICDKECEEEEKSRKTRYQRCQVLYGDVGSFQRDLLLTDFFDKGITMNRETDIIFVDEVDSMLLDKGENILYMSHSIPELKFLWPLFIEIWQAVHAPDVCLGRNQDLFLVCRFIKKQIQEKQLIFPNCMTDFIMARLLPWVQNAYLAKGIKEKDSYVIANYDRKGQRVVIMDKDTGVEQMSMNWSNGLHQFVQLKHSDSLSTESLKAVFMSNICYFRKFAGRLFGITGTLGSSVERDLLSQCYSVDVFEIPRFTARRCYEEEPIITQTRNDWLDKIQKSVSEQVNNGRAVLIICESIEMVEAIGTELKKTNPKDKVYAYHSSFDKEFKRRRSAGPLAPGDVIVATNIAGRGTDLKTSKELEGKGGLHVILSYVPPNVRIEEQAFGRTARAGLSGTVQYIVQAPGNYGFNSVDDLLRIRDDQESERLNNFRLKSISRIEIEEKLCEQFNVLLNLIKERLLSMKLKKPLREMHIENLKNKWALWLDSMSEKIRLVHLTSENPVLAEFERFRVKMLGISQFKGGTSQVFENGPIEITNLGRHFEEEKDNAKALVYYGRAIEKEPYYSEIAHYYMASCIIKETSSGVDSKQKAIKHLKIAEKLIKKRMNLLYTSSQTLSLTDDMRRTAGEATLANRYEGQVKSECELLQVHLGKIGDAMGVVLNGKFLAGIKGVLDEAEGDAIFKVLLTHTNILKKYRLSKKIDIKSDVKDTEVRIPQSEVQGSWDQIVFPPTFRYCQDEVYDLMKEKLRSGYRVLELTDLEPFILTQTKLWAVLLSQGLISNEEVNNVEMVTFNEARKAFDELEFPVNLVDFKTAIDRALTESDTLEYQDTIFESFGFEPSQLAELKTMLLNSKVITLSEIRKARVSNRFTWNPLLSHWSGIPDSCKKYSDVIECIVECPSADGGPTLKEELRLNEIPLPQSVEGGSKQLWAFFVESGLLKDPKINFSIQIAKKQGEIDDRIKEIKKALESCKPLSSVLSEYHPDKDSRPSIDDILEILQKAVGTIKTIPDIEISYQELSEYFKTGDYPPQIEEFRDKMFFHVLECTEKKSWWDWGAFIVAMIGIAQIVAGVLLEVFTAGAATYIAMGLISEGIGDIAFAIQAGISKSFSWKDYGIHKAISIAISIATAGIGSYLSRGAQVARFAGKTGFQLFKAVGVRVLKKTIEVVAFTLTDIGIEKLLDQIRQEILSGCRLNLTKDVSSKTSELESELEAAMDSVFNQSYENGQAQKLIEDSFAQVLSTTGMGKVGKEIYSKATAFSSQLASQMGTAGKKLFQHGTNQLDNMNLGGSNAIAKSAKLIKIVKYVGKLLKTISIVKSLGEMAHHCITLVNNLIKKLKAVAVNLKKSRAKKQAAPQEKNQESFTRFKAEFCTTINMDIVNYIMSQVQKSMIQPAFNQLTHSALQRAGKAIASRTNNMLKTLGKEKNIGTISEYRRHRRQNALKGYQIQAKLEGKVDVSELSPDAQLFVKDGANKTSTVTLEEARKLYGDSVELYQNKQGQTFMSRPSFEQCVDTFGEGKTSGILEIMVCAKYLKGTIKIEDTTGELQTDSADGFTYIKGGGKKGPVFEVVYSKNEDGQGHFSPKINGEVIDLPQAEGDRNTCLYQSLNFINHFKDMKLDKANNSDEFNIPDQLINESPSKFISNVRAHALSSGTIKGLYKQGVNELAVRFQIGMPVQKDLSAQDVLDLKLSQTSVGRQTMAGMPIEDLMNNMKTDATDGWKGDPIEVVEMQPGEYTSLDNRRVVAAKVSGVQTVPVLVYGKDEEIPRDQRFRYGHVRTASDAVKYRMRKGSLDKENIADLNGFTPNLVRIRSYYKPSLAPFRDHGFQISNQSRNPNIQPREPRRKMPAGASGFRKNAQRRQQNEE